MYSLLGNLVNVGVDNGLWDILNSAVLNAFFKGNKLRSVEHGNFINVFKYYLSRAKSKLAAVGAVYLVAVVFGGVMACGNNDTRAAAESPYSIGKHRRRHKLAVDVYLYAVCSKNCGSFLGENVGLYAAVVSDSHRGICGESLVNIVCKTLCCSAYSINVHSVGACADNAAQTARTKFKIAVKSVCDSVGISCNGFKLGLKIGIVGGFFAPKGVKLGFVHNNTSISLIASGVG